VVNIKNLGYDYKMPDFDEPVAAVPTPHIRISGINRASIGGSFFVSAWAFKSNAEPLQLVGIEPVLSRWHVSGCANCSNHLEVKAFFPLTGWNHEDAKNTSFEGRVHTKGDRQGLKAPVGVPRLRLGGLPKQGGGVPKPRLVPAPT
jgi:tyrosinase